MSGCCRVLSRPTRLATKVNRRVTSASVSSANVESEAASHAIRQARFRPVLLCAQSAGQDGVVAGGPLFAEVIRWSRSAHSRNYFSRSASSSVIGTLNAIEMRSMLPIEIFRSPRSTELM